MPVKANTGLGATVSLTNQTIVVGPKKISVGGKKIGKIDVTELDHERGDPATLIPGDVAEIDEVTIEGNFDSEAEHPKLGDVSEEVSTGEAGEGDTMTITWPLYPGQTTAAKLSGTGFFTEIEYPEFENEEVQDGKMVWCFNGKTGPTYTPAE